GISGVNADNYDTLNGYVGGQSVAVADISALVTQVDHLLVLRDYSADSTNTEPTLANFTGAGVSTARTARVDDYNAELVNQTLTTEPQFQALVDAINALDDYATGTSSISPTLTIYHTAGFSELSEANVASINQAVVANGANTLAGLTTLTNAYITLVNYAKDPSTTAPTVQDYTDAGFTDVSATILTHLNNTLEEEKREGLTHYLKASDLHTSDGYGWRTAISDDSNTLAVLAYRAPAVTTSTTDDAGAIYLYRRSGASWQEVQVLRSNNTSYHAHDMVMSADGKRLGVIGGTYVYFYDVPLVDSAPDWDGTWSVTSHSHGISDTSNFAALSADGNTLVVSGDSYNNYQGRIRIHQYENGTWTYKQQITGGSTNSYYGIDVAVSGDGGVIVVGAPDQSNTGFAYIYRHNGTSWVSEQSVRNTNYATDDFFGYAVSINRAGDRIAVGARLEDGATNSVTDQGAVFVFDHDGNTWSQTQALRASDAAPADGYGGRVALSPNGAKVAVTGLNSEALYTYDISSSDNNDWQGTETIIASPSTRTDEFGNPGLAFNGRDIVVGAYADDYNYNGVLINADNNTVFDANDTSSNDSTFDNTDISVGGSGAAYVVAYQAYALADSTALQARIDASNTVLAWAGGGSTEPTVDEYDLASIDNVTAENLTDVNTQLQLLAHTEMADVQPMVDAINTILAYTTDGTNSAPTLTDYQLAGLSDAASSNLTLLNTDVADGAHSLTTIDTLATQAVQLAILRDYSADNTNPLPTIDNFTNAGLSAALSVNLNDYNRELDNQTLATRVEFEALVSAINTLDTYTTDQTTPAPTYDTYVTAGFETAKQTQIDSLNQALAANTLLTLADIDVVVDGLATLTNYALDDTNTEPSVQDYLDAGLTDVSAAILAHLNQTLDREQQTAFAEYFKSSTPHTSDHYGFVTALSDDGQLLAVLAHRAPGVDNNESDDAGAVYVYRRTGDSWTEVAILRSNQTSNHAYDMAMSADGTRIFMIAPTYAYIFDVAMVNSAPDWDGTWTMTTHNHGITDTSNHLAISADGATFAVGGDNYNSNRGRVRLHRLVDGSWTFQQELYGNNTSNYFYGHGVSLSEDGNVLAVGEYDQADYGLVRIYRHNGSQWASDQNFRHSNYGSDDHYGFSVSLNRAGTRLAVGARYEDGESNNITNQGAVYVHDYIDDSWTQTTVLRASDAASSDSYGWGVALNPEGSQLVVSTGNGEAVYHYDLSALDSSEWQASEQIFASPASDTDEFGTYGLAFNGNAIAVGAYYDDNAFAGYVSNTEIDGDFNELDTASVGTFDKEDDTISNSGA
ncbi:hypothetical protein UB34_20390, partial [Photobacterium leiognathi]